ncbi:interacting like [Cryptosporidium sp. chipmunk genotype I]|uniref:interacting like n=1 Tax=Cryptosporidium sp. chipmunk genotype I TaxID=1280935 RepID=UPI00351A3F1F|nr:interacting like [Cryptosporidium sp. chipmunk genotype I]
MLENGKSKHQKTRKLDNYCNVCEKGFINHEKYAYHILNFHVACDEENCNYSAPKEIMYYHRLKHINNNEGNSIIESTEEIERWLIRRKMKYPRSEYSKKNYSFKSQDSNEIMLDEKKFQDTGISALEHYIRINMNNQTSLIHNAKPNKFLNKKNCNSNLNVRKIKMNERAFQENKRIHKSLLFRIFENEICMYERKMIFAINYIIKSYSTNCSN